MLAPVPYAIEFRKSAHKEFLDCEKSLQSRIVEALQTVAANPFSELIQIKKLKGAVHLYRVRLGDWRLVYELNTDKKQLIVVKIGHRKEVYRFIKG